MKEYLQLALLDHDNSLEPHGSALSYEAGLQAEHPSRWLFLELKRTHEAAASGTLRFMGGNHFFP